MKKILIASVIVNLLFSVSAYSQGVSLELADKLEKGQPYSEKFVHPFSGETLERKIVGIEDGKCLYIEEMPNGGKMECRYSEEQRKAVAQFYRQNINSTSSSSIRVKLGDTVTQEAKYFINGKEVSNPLDECVKDGTCVITGY